MKISRYCNLLKSKCLNTYNHKISYDILFCVGAQPMDSDAIGQETLTWAYYCCGRPQRHVPTWSQCHDWTGPCGSYYSCKMHLSNNHQREKGRVCRLGRLPSLWARVGGLGLPGT